MNGAQALGVSRTARPDGIVVLDLTGELTVLTRNRLDGADSDAASVVILAHGLTHIDTPGLATLVRLAGSCTERGGRLVVAGLDSDIHDMRHHLFLDQAILFADDLEDAVALVSAAP
ncbi:MAG TPA: STAS domain-containing protein [Gemmatimonadota bacterium]|nr:STAS domain-containing protein [Gemmatimonadota bacterium]